MIQCNSYLKHLILSNSIEFGSFYYEIHSPTGDFAGLEQKRNRSNVYEIAKHCSGLVMNHYIRILCVIALLSLELSALLSKLERQRLHTVHLTSLWPALRSQNIKISKGTQDWERGAFKGFCEPDSLNSLAEVQRHYPTLILLTNQRSQQWKLTTVQQSVNTLLIYYFSHTKA